MLSPLTQSVRSRWLAITLHLAFWFLVFLTWTHLGGKAPEYRESNTAPRPAESPVPVHKLNQASRFGPDSVPAPATNAITPFFTTHFVPPPAPTPPPPTTRKVQMVYQGYFESAETPKHAIIRIATNLVYAQIGMKVDTNLFVAAANPRSLTLTNLASQTNSLPLNVPTTLEIPLP